MIFVGLALLFFFQYCSFVSSYYYLTYQSDYDYLYQLYNATNGKYWKWTKPYSIFGQPWDFSNYYTKNPCRQFWQGAFCSPSDCSSNENGTICSIFTVNLDNMNLTGTLPPIAANLSGVYFYDVSSNNLHGHLPILKNMPALQYINFSYNHFTGTIPNNFLEVDNVPYLYLIYLSNNQLIGKIPDLFYNLSKQLQYFNVFNNSLTGTISNRIGSLNNSIYINYGDNFFSGTIPESFNQLTQMKQLFLCNNQLTGTIPLNLPHLEVLWVDHNRLIGTLPSFLCEASNITVISASHNSLTGTVPSCLSQLNHITVLQVQNNYMGGNLLDVFDASIQKQLNVVDISDNSFTSTFPLQIFQLPSLSSLAAVKNCFVGSLPESICDNITDTLSVMSLDGLHSASSCVHYYWNPFAPSDAGYYATLMEGTIPSCFWTLPDLTTLHLSGNGFEGTIPNIPSSALPKALSDVALTHNRLHGTIPASIQQYPFLTLDLSFNKFKGYVTNFTMMPFDYSKSSSFAFSPSSSASVSNTSSSTSASLNLQNNRLSGDVPNQLQYADNIQVLLGNVFECSPELPKNDPNALNYLCGSTELDTASVVFSVYFGIIIGTVVAALGLGYYYLKEILYKYSAKAYSCISFLLVYIKVIEEVIKFSYEDPFSLKEEQILYVRYKNLYQFLYSLTLVRKIAIYTTLYILFICFPVYIIFYEVVGNSNDGNENNNDIYSKYDMKYAWMTTAAFLTGIQPAITLFILWFALLLFVLYWIFIHFDLHQQETTPLSRMVSSVKNSLSGLVNISVDGRANSNLRVSILSSLSMSQNVSKNEGNDTNTSEKRTSLQPVYNNENSYYSRKRAGTLNSSKSFSRSSLSGSLFERPKEANSPIPPGVVTTSSPQIITDSAPFTPAVPIDPRKSRSFRPSVTRNSEIAVRDGVGRESEFRGSVFTTFRDSIAFIQFSTIHDIMKDEEVRNRIKYYSLYLFILLFNATVCLTVNTAYLIVQNANNLPTNFKVFMQVLMASFKLLWNMVLIRKMVTWLQPFEKSVTRLHVGMLVFNSILAPCFATAFTDSSCFAEVFVNTETITSSYTLTSCIESYQESYGAVISTVCTHYDTVVYTTEFTPTFIYYYTCTTKLLMLYIPVFIYTYTILFIASTMIYVNFIFFPASYIPSIILHRIDGVLRPQNRGQITFHKLIRCHSIQALLTQHIIVLLTFGLNSPILAAIMMITISYECYVWQLIITRFVKYECISTPFSPDYNLSHTGTIVKSKDALKVDSKEEKDADTVENPILSTVNPPPLMNPTLPIRKESETDEERIYGKSFVGNSSPSPQRMNSVEMIISRENSIQPMMIASDDSMSIIDHQIVKKGMNEPPKFDLSPDLTVLSPKTPFNELPRFNVLLSNANEIRRKSAESLESGNFLQVQELLDSKQPEQLRLAELHAMIDDAWLCLYNARWLLFYCAGIFNSLILYDMAGDAIAWRHALLIPLLFIFLIIVTRIAYIDIMIYLYNFYAVYWKKNNPEEDYPHSSRKQTSFTHGTKSVDSYHYDEEQVRPTITRNEIQSSKILV